MKKIFFLLQAAVMGLQAMSQGNAPSLVGRPAPELNLKDLNGASLSLSGLKGSVVLVDFWASWCGPCRKNNPHLLKLYKKYHADGLEILGVSLDDNTEAWKSAVSKDKLNWPQVVDEKGGAGPSAAAYGVYEIPASFLVDKNGIIRAVNLVGWGLEANIKTLLHK